MHFSGPPDDTAPSGEVLSSQYLEISPATFDGTEEVVTKWVIFQHVSEYGCDNETTPRTMREAQLPSRSGTAGMELDRPHTSRAALSLGGLLGRVICWGQPLCFGCCRWCSGLKNLHIRLPSRLERDVAELEPLVGAGLETELLDPLERQV